MVSALASASFVFVLCISGLASATSGAAGQEPASPDEDPRALDRRRLFTLEDGRIVRARSRFQDGHWEQRVGPRWVPLDAGGASFARVRLEREVLAEAERMRSALGREDFTQRVALARWMVGQGLNREAIVQLDRVLRPEPEHAAALELIRTVNIPLEIESAGDAAHALQALVKHGAGAKGARREIAVQRLAEMNEVVDVESVVRAELGTMQRTRRAFATLVARRLFRGELLQELVSRAILDGSRDVRTGAAFALRDAGEVAVLGPTIRALGSKHTSVRANAAEAMGNMGYPAAVEPLISHLAYLQSSGGAPSGARANLFLGNQTAYVMDYDVEIAQAASIADPIIGVQASGVVLDVRTTVQMTKVIEMRATVRALEQLTGERPRDWAKWWEESGAEWRSLDRSGG